MTTAFSRKFFLPKSALRFFGVGAIACGVFASGIFVGDFTANQYRNQENSEWLASEYSGEVYNRLFVAKNVGPSMTPREIETFVNIHLLEAAQILLWRFDDRPGKQIFSTLEEPEADVRKVINAIRERIGEKPFWGTANSEEGRRVLSESYSRLCQQTDPVLLRKYQWRAVLCNSIPN